MSLSVDASTRLSVDAPRRSLGAQFISTLVLAGLVAMLIVRAARPPEPVPASASTTVFSAERAMTHVRAIAERPHPIGSVDEARVRGYVETQLTKMGLPPSVQEVTAIGTRYQEAGHVKNILARIPGRTPGGPAVLLMSHYDGVPAGPAAGDDASGTAVLLETARAIRAGPPLAHDVILLITDGEEAGLLGAAAFVREHPWAKDVAVTLNFEARGTTGRSFMFETGPGNLDVARALRGAGDVSATSLSVAVYRTLPNDTDLSELHALGKPAMNFAFADGVERYHTTSDDVSHLNPGSVQHDGQQALAMARAFGDGVLPRPVTGDAVFFDLPFVGLIVYPEGWALPIALLAAALTIVAFVRTMRTEPRAILGATLGAVGLVLSAVLAVLAAIGATRLFATMHASLGGEPAWSGVYALAVSLLALCASLIVWAIMRRWASAGALAAGALLLVMLVSVYLTTTIAGASFMFVWPVIVAAIARIVAAPNPQAIVARLVMWIATFVVAAILVPIIYTVGAVMLGVVGPGALAMAVLTPVVAWLLAPQMAAHEGERATSAPLFAFVMAFLCVSVGALTVRRTLEHPAPSGIIYALDADGSGAWLTSPDGWARKGSWGAAALGDGARTVPGARKDSAAAPSADAPPEFLRRVMGFDVPTRAASVTRLQLTPPEASVLSDSTSEGKRQLTLRLRTAPGTLRLTMRAAGARVLASAIDGRVVDTTRYRRSSPTWTMTYSAPPDSGITVALTLPAGADPGLELVQWTSGVPTIPDHPIPLRPIGVAPAHSGNGTAVYRKVVLAR